jgi:hypothetical protein
MSSPIIIITPPPHPQGQSLAKIPDGLNPKEVAKILRDAADSLDKVS